MTTQRPDQSKAPSWLPFAPWLFVCLWSAGYGVAKLCLEYTSPLNLLAMRFVLTASILALPLVFYKVSFPSWRALGPLCLVSLCIHVVHFGLVYGGLSFGASAGVLALFAASQPLLVEISVSLFYRRFPRVVTMTGLGLGMAGAAYVIIMRHEFSAGALLGALMGFLAVVSFSIGTACDRYRTKNESPLAGYFVQYLFAAIVSLPLAYAVEGLQITPHINLLAGVGYLVLGNAIVGIFLLLTMVQFNSLSRVTSVMFLVPGLGALIAWLVVGEAMPFETWPGIIMAGLGVIMVLYAETIFPSKNNGKQDV